MNADAILIIVGALMMLAPPWMPRKPDGSDTLLQTAMFWIGLAVIAWGVML